MKNATLKADIADPKSSPDSITTAIEEDSTHSLEESEETLCEDVQDAATELVTVYPLPQLGVWGNKIAAKLVSIPCQTHLANTAHVLVILRILFPQSLLLRILTIFLMIIAIVESFIPKEGS